MSETQIAPQPTTQLRIERLHLTDTLRWRDLVPEVGPERVRADLVALVCGKMVHFPAVSYAFGFDPMSTTSLKAVLQAVVALSEGTESGWREGHGGIKTHLLHLGKDPAERFEFFIFDDRHLYLAYHSNLGGMLALDLLLSISDLVKLEEQATRAIAEALDSRLREDEDDEARSRYLGRWEHLKERAMALEGHMAVLVPATDDLYY